MFDEAIAATKALDVAKLTALEGRFTNLKDKYNASLFDSDVDQLNKLQSDADAQEDELMAKAEEEVRLLREKYGERWVSGELQFKAASDDESAPSYNL